VRAADLWGTHAQEAAQLEGERARLATTSRDCAALVPGDAAGAAVRGAALESELAAVDRELADADAQHRLYTLLGERTRCVPPHGRHGRPNHFNMCLRGNLLDNPVA